MSFFKKITIGALLLFGFLCNSQVSMSSDNYITVEELIEIFKTKDIDRIRGSLRVVRRMENRGEALFFLKDLWGMKQRKYPELDWVTINKDIVKIAIVDNLVVGQYIGKIRVNTNKMRDYVLSVIHSDDLDLASDAIVTLGYVNDQRDVNILFSIAKQQQRETFGVSIIALSLMCPDSALKAMFELEKHIKIKEFKSYLIAERERTIKDRRRGSCIGR